MKSDNKLPGSNYKLPQSRGLFFVGLAFLFLIIIFWHTILFADQNYRQDEINTVHAAYALDYSGVANWLSHEGTHPLGWRIFAMEYIRFFGMDRSITRFMSSFFTIITLASIYQLGKQLFDYHLGIISTVLFGFFQFTAWHTHELRPYAPFLALITLLTLIYIKWLKKQNLYYAIALLILGALSIEVHFYAGLVMVALFLFTVVFMKWNKARVYKLFGIFALVGLSFSWWLPSLYRGAFVTRDSGINYAFENSPRSLFIILLVTFGFPLFSAILALSPKKRYALIVNNQSKFNQLFRDPVHWRQWFLLTLSFGVFLIAWMSNYVVGSLSARNLLTVMPFYALTIGYLINYFAKPRLRYFTAFLLAIAFIIITLSGTTNYYDNIPLYEMSEYIEQPFDENTGIITEINMANRSSETIVYYMMDRLPNHPTNHEVYSIAEPEFIDKEFFEYTIERNLNKSATIDAETLEKFETFLTKFDRIWYIEYVGLPLVDDRPTGDIYREILEENFTVVKSKTFKSGEVLEFEVKEYMRK